MPAVANIPALTLLPIELPMPLVTAVRLPDSVRSDAASLTALLYVEQTVQRAAALTINEYVVRIVEWAKLARYRLYGASLEQMEALMHYMSDDAEVLVQGSSAAQPSKSRQCGSGTTALAVNRI